MSEIIEVEAAGLDTDECPDCDGDLTGWVGEMGEQLECEECEARFEINSVSWLERV